MNHPTKLPKFKPTLTILFILFLSVVLPACKTGDSAAALENERLSLLSAPPDTVPQIFAKDLISTTGTREGAITFAPDMNGIYFTKVDSGGRLRIMEMEFVNGSWSQPQIWNRSDQGNNAEPFISPDGKNFFFISNRHAPDSKGSGRIWMSKRFNEEWSEPKIFLENVSTDKGLWFPTVSRKGTLFFGAYLDSIGNYGKSDIYTVTPGEPSIKNAGSVINSPFEEWDPYVAPDESYLLFESDRPGGYGAVDIYVSFNNNGTWSQPVNLGPTVNSKGFDVAAKVSPNGKYLFFDRPRKDEQDIYWVSADVIEKLKHR